MEKKFYIKIPINPRSKILQMAHKLVDILKTNKVNKYNVDNFCDEIKKKFKEHYIYLGRKKDGWAFLWNTNDLKYFEPTLASIKLFIMKNRGIIVDEYGKSYDWNIFIKEELAYCLHPCENITIIRNNVEEIKTHCYTCESYYEKHPQEVIFFNLYNAAQYKLFNYERFGKVNYNYGELITNENLRFAIYREFL